MRLPTLALHGAQILHLQAHTDYKVFDENPVDEAFPYVVLGAMTVRDWSDKLEDGTEVFSTIHVWSRYNGRKEADEMADGLLLALSSGEALNLGASFSAAFSRLDSYNLMVDLDGKTRHGILIFKYYIEQA